MNAGRWSRSGRAAILLGNAGDEAIADGPHSPKLEHLTALLVCPECRQGLEILRQRGIDGVLGHVTGVCQQRYPVIDGIPRLLRRNARAAVVGRHNAWFSEPYWDGALDGWHADAAPVEPDYRIVERFDREWAQFSKMESKERGRIFDAYFDLVDADVLRAGNRVLDAGCGSGRWAFEMASRGATVIAMDLGLSIEVAGRNTSALGVHFVQADIRDTPFRPDTFDFACSLGVLHHVPETEAALAAVCSAIRPQGSLLLYLYYALETRPSWYRLIFRLSAWIRRLLSVAPQPLTRLSTTAIAAGVYWPLARLSGALHRVGLNALSDALPLSFYRHLSFRTMRNDSLDRFGTALEKRYTAAELAKLMSAAGLQDVRISPDPPYWHALARRSPATSR